MVLFRVREKENCVCLVGGKNQELSRNGEARGGCRWEQGRCGDMQVTGEVVEARGSATSVFVAREETEGVTGEAKVN